MDPRYTGRPASPRRYGQPGRSSTGRLDMYPPDYDSYYAPPRSSRESVVPAPRSSAERVVIPRSEPRLHRDSVARARPDDYYVPPRRDPLPTVSRRPLSVITSSESPNRYPPVVSSAVDHLSSPHKNRSREPGSYYMLPASSSSHHHRHLSAGGEDSNRYLDAYRERRPEKGGYRSSGPSKGSIDYPRSIPQIREPRDAEDREYGYEYTNRQEQVQRDTAPRPRTRRVSDLGSRERPYSVIGGVDYDRPPRESGPPVTTRGFSKIDPNGTVRHEYRVPKENNPSSRDHSLGGDNRDNRDPNRLRPSRGSVAVHQDKGDGYSSNIEERTRDKHHRHRRNDSLDRDSDRGLGIRHVDDRRFEDRGKTHLRADSEDRHPRTHRHRDASEDRFRPSAQSRRHERNEDHRERKYHDEPRKEKHEVDEKHEKHDKHEKEDKHHDHKKLAEGLGLGAAGAAAAGLVAESIKHRRDKDASDIEDDEDGRGKSHRHERHRKDADKDKGSRSDESDTDYRERRRRRRREREEREKRERDGDDLSGAKENGKSSTHDHSAKPAENNGETDDDRDRRSRRRHRRERKDSDPEPEDETARMNKERSRVRVVSPPREAEKKPRGILRPPTQKFPEDPAPIREGVAPLKDAGKKGIPPNARWTKIDRRLVNPEALELGNERYEERDDYVIVLRVLSKEDIEKYAEVTSELRNRRARGDKEEAPRAIDAQAHHDDSEDAPPLQLDNVPYNPQEPLPVRDRSLGNDLQPSTLKSPPAMAETVVNAHQQRAAAVAAEEEHSDRDRPTLPTGGSYHRVAPPNVQPPSSIPMYPPVNPPSSSPPVSFQAQYMPPPANVPDPAASWHGSTGTAGAYPTPPSLPHSQGHTPPPPIPPKEVERRLS